MTTDRGGAYGSGWPRDHEKAPTTPAAAVVVAGVRLSSRYQKHDEMVAGTRIIEALPAELRDVLSELWCDSKATWVWSAELRAPHQGDMALEQRIAAAIGAAALEISGGHNGVWVGEGGCADPEWRGDGEEPIG